MGRDSAALTDVNRIIIPVAPGHVLVDIGVDPRHDG